MVAYLLEVSICIRPAARSSAGERAMQSLDAATGHRCGGWKCLKGVRIIQEAGASLSAALRASLAGVLSVDPRLTHAGALANHVVEHLAVEDQRAHAVRRNVYHLPTLAGLVHLELQSRRVAIARILDDHRQNDLVGT